MNNEHDMRIRDILDDAERNLYVCILDASRRINPDMALAYTLGVMRVIDEVTPEDETMVAVEYLVSVGLSEQEASNAIGDAW